jgi:tripartite-type tricarboxylate transporter receptor subunit TctC
MFRQRANGWLPAILLSAFCFALDFPIVAESQAQEPFYQGKTIRIVVGLPAGDVYDIWARLLANHMGRNIPGKPNIIVQNMTGAATMIAANHVYSVGKPDGLTLGMIIPSIYFDQLLSRKEVQFDYSKFTWVGSTVKGEQQMYMRADAPYKTVEDVRKASAPPKCGSTGTGSPSYYLPRLMEEVLGAKFTVVTGYQGGQDIDLAVERGEVVCRAFTIEAFFAREPFHTWRKTGFVRNLMQTGRKRDEKLPNVPTIHELMDQYKTPESGRRLATVVLGGDALGRPLLATPGIPPDRVKVLRDAFAKTMTDPEFLAEVKKLKYELDPTPGEELEALAKELIAQPPDVVARLRNLLGK